ncbi:MAG TPA: zf-HC2 domain-containing protein [Candidatus Saccharimonadales bacterium]|nr:zf-HC2 domain-containing protein [Candidatus Saccharimonadales bacterium]
MNCLDVMGRLSDYIDQEVAGEVCKELEAHLATCPHCRIEVNTLRRTVELYHRIPSSHVPGEVEERLFKVLNLRR